MAISQISNFEGMQLADLGLFLPSSLAEELPLIGPIVTQINGYKSRNRMLRALKMIISGGDPSLVDAGQEAIRVARFFNERNLLQFPITEKDFRDYETSSLREEWNQKRPEIAENYGLQNTHAFFGLFNTVDIGECDVFRSLTSFTKLADELPKILPQLEKNGELNVLYPGSCGHIAPLATAMELIDEERIGKASFIYTDINSRCWLGFQKLLNATVDDGIFESQQIGMWRVFKGEDGKERDVVVIYKGHPITITFALNRSGAKYYRPEYLQNTDLIVIHDPGGYFEGSAELLADILMDLRNVEAERNRVVIMEGMANDTLGGPDRNPFPQDMVQYEIKGPYGHYEVFDWVGEVGKSSYNSARVFLLNDPALQKFAAAYSTVEELAGAIYKAPPKKGY